jgi:16S rRNA C1402 (ribose-2'-O) methylase RsmI
MINDNGGKTGHLIVGSMHIGEFEDLSIRMVEALKTVDVIFSDDHAEPLFFALERLGIKDKHVIILNSMHSTWADQDQVDAMVDYINNGKTVLLLASEGQITLGDPGAQFVQECIRLNLPYTTYPGVTTYTAGLVATGLCNGVFLLHTSLETSIEEDLAILKNRGETISTIVFHRDLDRTLKIIEDTFKYGDMTRAIFICCNLTRGDEFIISGTPDTIRSKPGYEKMHEKTKITIVIGNLMKKDDPFITMLNS